MTFDEAMTQCQPGHYVKHEFSPWNEHDCQYGCNDDGSQFWTAGNTVGGPLTADRRPSPGQEDGKYAVYSRFGAPMPIYS